MTVVIKWLVLSATPPRPPEVDDGGVWGCYCKEKYIFLLPHRVFLQLQDILAQVLQILLKSKLLVCDVLFMQLPGSRPWRLCS